MEKEVWAGAHHPSFQLAAEAMNTLAEVPLSKKRVHRATSQVGEDRLQERQNQVAEFRTLTLTERDNRKDKPGKHPGKATDIASNRFRDQPLEGNQSWHRAYDEKRAAR